jgi:hypothetical protein
MTISPQERLAQRLTGVAVGFGVALVLALLVAGSLGQLVRVLVVALPHALVLTFINTLLFAEVVGRGGARSGAILGGILGGVIGLVESALVWRASPTPPSIVIGVIGVIVYVLALTRTFASALWSRVTGWLNRILSIETGLPLPRQESASDLYYRPYPRRLQINWVALILGPFWYLLAGLWVHAAIFFSLIFVSGGLLAPFVWIYCGLKADEDLLEFRVSRRSVY